jgi:MYXO-CTERM domain-containing protein
MRLNRTAIALFVAGSATTAASAGLVQTVGGQTNVLLDLALLQAAANLTLTGASDGVITPGNLGAGSVAFVITPPTSAALPTTFQYETKDFFGTFSGSINHRGSITFNDAVTVGNFEILFDNGFKVADRVGGLGVLFDVAITGANPAADTFTATGDLLVSANFADASIQGINAAIPSPGAVAVLGVAAVFGARRRRR